MAAVSFRSVPEMFLHRVASTPDADAFYSPDGERWRTWSWGEVGEQTRAIACGLRSLGLELEQRVALLCSTRLEWILVDLGVLCAGGATSTLYPSSTAEECAYILQDSGSVILFAEDGGQLDKLRRVRERLPALHTVVVLEGPSRPDEQVISLTDLIERGRAWDREHPTAFGERIKQIGSTQLATLIYTSGTTGNPKGVELTHDGWVFEAEAMDALGFLSPADKQYLWLPLAHSFGKVLEVAIIRIGIPTAIDGRLDRLVDNLKTIQPTFVAAVPRIFEKVYNKVVAGARESGNLRYRIFRWALDVGTEVSALKQIHQQPSGLLAIRYALAERLVFSKIKARFGGRLRFFISGSAPLSQELAAFFHAADVLILEGYGLTESSAASFVNRPDRYRFGSVGLPLPGVEVRLDPEDSEVLLRGRGIMRGYYNLPEQTQESLTPDRWLRTGDIGSIDSDGFLRIVDRKKDLIKTSGGKYVAPQKLEGKLKAACPYISQVVVHGDQRNFCVALLTLSEEDIRKWAEEAGLSHLSLAELAAHAHVRSLLQPYIDQLNAELSSYETLKYFAILPEDFSIEAGELTPSLKVKRRVVERKHQDLLDRFYTTTTTAS